MIVNEVKESDLVTLCQEDLIWKQLMAILEANRILKLTSVRKSPNYESILKNYNAGVEVAFNNLANMRSLTHN